MYRINVHSQVVTVFFSHEVVKSMHHSIYTFAAAQEVINRLPETFLNKLLPTFSQYKNAHSIF